MASRAIPSHLKPSSAAGKDEGGFNSQRHHGKSQSHVVSQPLRCKLSTCISCFVSSIEVLFCKSMLLLLPFVWR